MAGSQGYWQEASIPHHEELSCRLFECLHDMAAGLSDEKERTAFLLPGLGGHIPSHQQYSIHDK